MFVDIFTNWERNTNQKSTRGTKNDQKENLGVFKHASNKKIKNKPKIKQDTTTHFKILI